MKDPSAVKPSVLLPETIRECIEHLVNPDSGPQLRYTAAYKIGTSALPAEVRAMILVKCLDQSPHLPQQPIIHALGHVQHELSVQKLHAIVMSGNKNSRFIALKALARHRDAIVFEQCCYDICHGTPEQRRDGIILLGIMDTLETRKVLETLWNSSDLNYEHRVLVALRLVESGNRISEHFLELALCQVKNSSNRLPIGTQIERRIASADSELSITGALAFLRNPSGLLNMKELLGTINTWKLDWTRQLFSRLLGIPPDPVDNWRERALVWANEQLRVT